MAWSSTRDLKGCWTLQFASVKLAYKEQVEAAFDDLYLIIQSPESLHLVKHDLVTGVSASGKVTEVRGHSIKVHGSVGTHGWEGALNQILKKLCQHGSCSVVHEQPFSDMDFDQILRAGVPPAQVCWKAHVQDELGQEGQANTGHWSGNRPQVPSS